MNKSESVLDLVAGYERYSSPEEISLSAATDAPATTHYCAAAGLSWLSGQAISKTIDDGC